MNATGSNKPNTAIEKPHECKCTKNDKVTEYETLIRELEEQVKSGKDVAAMLSGRIANTIREYEDKLADKQLDNDSIKRDYYQVREENNRLQQQVIEKDYIVENQKYQLGQYAKENEDLQEENEKLKYFALKYLVV